MDKKPTNQKVSKKKYNSVDKEARKILSRQNSSSEQKEKEDTEGFQVLSGKGSDEATSRQPKLGEGEY